MTDRLRIGVIGDDFTGSSDIANTLARAGAHTAQLCGLPAKPLSRHLDAAVVALKTRSIPAAEAVWQTRMALRWLLEQGAEQIVFKICSTFDSTPEGNIGPVAEALLTALDAPFALVCPAFPRNRRTVYQGHLFVGDALLNESGMEKHPLNPMTDSDLRRWLARQTSLAIGHLPLEALRSGQAEAALANVAASGARLIIADAIADEDLLALGRMSRGHRLIIGGSGIALGLPANFAIDDQRQDGVLRPPGSKAAPRRLALSGSCSSATRKQVAEHLRGNPALRLDADALVADPASEMMRAEQFLAGCGSAAQPLIYSSADPEEVGRAQDRHGAAKIANAFELFFARLARRAVAAGVNRLAVAGGETSSAVAGALDLPPLEIGPEIDPGVPVLYADGPRPLILALKSGNFGAPDFFAKAFATFEEQP